MTERGALGMRASDFSSRPLNFLIRALCFFNTGITRRGRFVTRGSRACHRFAPAARRDREGDALLRSLPTRDTTQAQGTGRGLIEVTGAATGVLVRQRRPAGRARDDAPAVSRWDRRPRAGCAPGAGAPAAQRPDELRRAERAAGRQPRCTVLGRSGSQACVRLDERLDLTDHQGRLGLIVCLHARAQPRRPAQLALHPQDLATAVH
jgi:hypothetical protein